MTNAVDGIRLIRRLPAGRSAEQVYRHYVAEKSISDRLKASTREERKELYRTMYDHLFKEVPDHPRLVIRESREKTLVKNQSKLNFLKKEIGRGGIFLEFAPGDCKFAIEMCRHFPTVYGVDISDQRNPDETVPPNFRLVIYDGYNLEIGEKVDLIFSDHLIEHFHPEDTRMHFELCRNMLRPGGKYCFRTPHAFTGPHDVSKYFSTKPEGFHLKEWTYAEMFRELKASGFSRASGCWSYRGTPFVLPQAYFLSLEKVIGNLDPKLRNPMAKALLREINVIAEK